MNSGLKADMLLPIRHFPQETDHTCAPACLRMALVFRFSSKSVAEADIAKRCRCKKGLGCRTPDVYNAALRLKLPAVWLDNERIEAEVEAAFKAGCPVLANVQLRALPYYPSSLPKKRWHSVLIVGIDDQDVYLHDPNQRWGGANLEVERADFFLDWTFYHYSAYRL